MVQVIDAEVLESLCVGPPALFRWSTGMADLDKLIQAQTRNFPKS
jgi:hypothetical protein